ncbi:MAG TPA: hypothetical protein VK696_07410 [Steroidobacteraceae bacterium]|jgi:hypothetical protein|nr:hypothetical protein [Steroidobacteraceae bacterium]
MRPALQTVIVRSAVPLQSSANLASDEFRQNRSPELHAFHIHQLHFQLREWYGIKVEEPFLRDTVNVPYFDNHMTAYPSVTVRMDFAIPIRSEPSSTTATSSNSRTAA